MLTYSLCALIVVVGIVLAIAALKPDEFRLSRSIVIDAPPERVFPFVDNLRTFATWSPYELKDPDMKRTFKGPENGKGAIYEWDGDNNVGKGGLLISDSRPSSLVAIDLGMERPIAVANLVTFTFVPEGGNTNVTWTIASSRTITWTHNFGLTGTFTIEVSRDGGTTWSSVASGVPATTATAGSYSWIVTGPATTQAKVRVSSGAAVDRSNVNFRIQ